MPQRPPPSRPFASAPNRAGPTRLFASVRHSGPTSTQERPPRRAANSSNEPGSAADEVREGASLNDAAAHRAAFALDEPPGCPVAKRNFRDEGDTPKDALSCARATACIDQLPIGARAHAHAADAVPDHGSIAAFVELVHLDALLEVEARFLESSVTAMRLQHDHAPTDDHHLAVTRMSQSAPRRKRAERAAHKIESEMRSPPPTPRGRLSPLLSP